VIVVSRSVSVKKDLVTLCNARIIAEITPIFPASLAVTKPLDSSAATASARSLKGSFSMRKIQRSYNLVASSGLIGISVVNVVTFISMTALSRRLLVATFCFSISIPFLAGTIFVLSGEGENKSLPATTSYLILFFGGCLCSLVGLGAVLFNLHLLAGSIFVVSVVIALFLSAMQVPHSEELRNSNSKMNP
jgi:hypothetical protein